MEKMPPFEFVSLPITFIGLLKSNMQTHSKAFLSLNKLLLEDNQIYSMAHRTFSSADKKFSVDKVLKNYGWLGFRDKVMANFLNHHENGFFSKNVSTLTLDKILNFEKTYSFLSLEGYSRNFLLGFYLSLMDFGSEHLEALLSPAFIKVIKLSKGRHIRTDIFLLTAYFLYVEMGEDLAIHISKGVNFEELFSMLSQSQKNAIVKNCLKYGSSIHDSTLFTPDVV